MDYNDEIELECRPDLRPILKKYWEIHAQGRETCGICEPPSFCDLEPAHPLPERLFHYSSLYKLAGKLRAGSIDIWPEPTLPSILSVAWCTSNPLWDCAAAESWLLKLKRVDDLARFHEQGAITNAARIVVDPKSAPWRWADYWYWCGGAETYIDDFRDYDRSICDSNSWEWFVTPFGIPAESWLDVEVWDCEKLCWISIHDSQDRMIRELIPLLPPHLQKNTSPYRLQLRLASEASASPWSLQNISSPEEYLHFLEDGYGEPLEDPQGAYDDYIATATRIRQEWLEADRLANCGIALLHTETADIDKASTSLNLVDKNWLLNRRDMNRNQLLSIVLGSRSRNLFIIRTTGAFRSYCPLMLGHPSTLTLHVNHQHQPARDYTNVLLLAPSGHVVESGVILDCEYGKIEVITEGIVPGPSSNPDKQVVRHDDTLLPATASPELLKDIKYRQKRYKLTMGGETKKL